MRSIRLALISSCFLLVAMPGGALAKPVYLSCPTSDPRWPPPLKIMVDEDRGEVSVSDRNNSGSSPNPVFSDDSVVFGFAGTRFYLSRINLTLVTGDPPERYRTVCKLGAPVKRAF